MYLRKYLKTWLVIQMDEYFVISYTCNGIGQVLSIFMGFFDLLYHWIGTSIFFHVGWVMFCESGMTRELDLSVMNREEVRRHMVEAQCSVQITFPVEFKGPHVVSTRNPCLSAIGEPFVQSGLWQSVRDIQRSLLWDWWSSLGNLFQICG